MATNNVAVVIPALNEEEALRHLLSELPSHLVQWIIVVDNGSTDATASVAQATGAIVVSEPVRGYGRACWHGFQTARELGAEIIVFMDGDGSDNPIDFPTMLSPILEGHADLVIGSRVGAHAEAGAIPPQARLGNWLISRLLNYLYGTCLHDIGSFRVIHRDVLEALKMRERTFGWPVEMLVKAARAHYRIIEVSLHYRRRSHGHSKVAGTVMGSVRAAYVMLRTMLRYAREREAHV
jgi:glycosyltransferase involved in cell wall biosynthesis